MATYFMFFRFTQKGLEHIQESPERIDALKQQFHKANAEIKAYYGLLGQYDTVFLVDSPNDETIARLALHIGRAGNGTCETHRAVNEDEYRKITRGV